MCSCAEEYRAASFALWLNFIVFASAFPAVLFAGVDIKHWQMSSLHDPTPLLIAFGSITMLNAAGIWSLWRDRGAAAAAGIKVALVADIVWNSIDTFDCLWTARHFTAAALAPLPDMLLCGYAIWSLPRNETSSDSWWML